MATLSGVVRDSAGSYAAKTVRVYRRDSGALVGQTVSNASTGAWSITTADTKGHFAIVHDTSDIDLNWLNVVLAMHMNDTGLTDVTGKTVTIGGNVARSSTQSKFGGYSAYFDGAGDYLQLANSTDFRFGSGDFTIEFQFYPLTTSGGSSGVSSLVSLWGNASNQSWVIYRVNSGFQFSFSTTGTNQTNAISVSSGVFSINNWYHVAVTRSGSNIRAFINGTQLGTTYNAGSSSFFASTNVLDIGYNTVASYGPENCYIDDLRITKGYARYTADFTAPTAAFPDGLSGGSQNGLILDLLTPA